MLDGCLCELSEGGGAMTTRALTFREAVNEAIRLEMRRDPTVILIGEDVAGGATVPHLEATGGSEWGGALGVTVGLAKEFGRKRILDTPISESAFMGAAVGAAMTGLRPIVELMFVDFFGVCMDQIYNQGGKFRYMFGGKAKVPVVIRTTIGAGIRAAAQHSGCHYSIFTHMPGLKTVVPSTPYDAKGLLISAIRDPDPILFFEHKLLYGISGEVPEGDYTIPLGVADIKRRGKDVTVVAIGRMVQLALEAAEKLSKDGMDLEVIDLRTLSPMDHRTILQSVKKTHRVVVVDEDNPRCSMACDIIALIVTRAFDDLDAPPQMVTAPHTPVPFSPPLEDYYIPNVEKIVSAVKSLVG
jgi:pyruvate/2-oxoglutarate/acetoin dehydrogenase E1 component